MCITGQTIICIWTEKFRRKVLPGFKARLYASRICRWPTQISGLLESINWLHDKYSGNSKPNTLKKNWQRRIISTGRIANFHLTYKVNKETKIQHTHTHSVSSDWAWGKIQICGTQTNLIQNKTTKSGSLFFFLECMEEYSHMWESKHDCTSKSTQFGII